MTDDTRTQEHQQHPGQQADDHAPSLPERDDAAAPSTTDVQDDASERDDERRA